MNASYHDFNPDPIEDPEKSFKSKLLENLDKGRFFLKKLKEDHFSSPQNIYIFSTWLILFLSLIFWLSYSNQLTLPFLDPDLSDDDIEIYQQQLSSLKTEYSYLKMSLLTDSKSSLHGTFSNVEESLFTSSGFKVAIKKTFSQNILPYQIDRIYSSDNNYNTIYLNEMRYVLVGARKKGDSNYIVSALGEGYKAFSNYNMEFQKSKDIYWYFNKTQSFGFSFYEDIYLNNIDFRGFFSKDENNRLRISVSLNGTACGRIGDVYISRDNSNLDDYELVISYFSY